MQGEWSCYRSGHQWRENDHVTEVESLMEGEWFCYRSGLFNGGVLVASLMEGEYSCYGGGQFKIGRMVMLQRWQV